MIQVVREAGTDYLFAGFLERELNNHQFSKDIDLVIEGRIGGEVHFSQDWMTATPETKFMFYALPSFKEEFELLYGKNCALVTYAANPRFHEPLKIEKTYDVGFIGKIYYEERSEYRKLLESKYNCFFKEDLDGTDIPEVLSKCKILFNHTRPEIDVNLRFFESMALGCQVMLRTPSLQLFANEEEHYWGYSSPEECVRVIDKLLNSDSLRENTSQRARNHLLSNHTYKHRAASVIANLEEYICLNQ